MIQHCASYRRILVIPPFHFEKLNHQQRGSSERHKYSYSCVILHAPFHCFYEDEDKQIQDVINLRLVSQDLKGYINQSVVQ